MIYRMSFWQKDAAAGLIYKSFFKIEKNVFLKILQRAESVKGMLYNWVVMHQMNILHSLFGAEKYFLIKNEI